MWAKEKCACVKEKAWERVEVQMANDVLLLFATSQPVPYIDTLLRVLYHSG